MNNILKYTVITAISGTFLFGMGMVVNATKDAAKKPAVPAPAAAGDKAKPVAQIGTNIVITVADVEKKINAQIPFIRKRFADDAEKKKFIESLVDQEILAMEATSLGYDKKPEVQDALKRVMIHRQRQVILDTRVKIADINDEETKNYFDKHVTEFKRPERRRVAVIFVKEEKDAKPIIDELTKAKNDLRTFQTLVKKHSVDEESKKRGGLLPLFEQDAKTIDASLVKAAFSIAKTGDLAPVIKTAKGWAIIRLSGISPKVEKDIKEVSDMIKKRILKEKQQKAYTDYIEELKKAAKITIHKDKFALVKIDTTSKNTLGGDFHNPGGKMRIPGAMMPGKRPGRRGPGKMPKMPMGPMKGHHGHNH